MQIAPLSAARSASASSTVPTMMIRVAPFASATAAFLAPSNRLWIEIIAAAMSGSVERSVWRRLARASAESFATPKGEAPMLIVDGQIHLWEKGTPSAPHRQEPYSAEQAIADMDAAGIDRALIHPVLWDPDSNELAEAA